MMRFRQNTPDCMICVYEWRDGRRDTLTIGGLLLTMPAQATVIRLFRSKPGSVPRQESMTAGTGERKVVAPMARKAIGMGFPPWEWFEKSAEAKAAHSRLLFFP